MREPSEGMCNAEGVNDIGSRDNVGGYLDDFSSDAVWRAMIDHLIREASGNAE